MVLWSLQIALNLLFIAALVYGFRTRQRLRELEEERGRPAPESPSPAPSLVIGSLSADLGPAPTLTNSQIASVSAPALSFEATNVEPVASKGAPGQMTEKNLSQAALSLSVAERYDKAEGLLAKGIKIQEVAKATGLSVSELRLLEKISTKSH